MAASVVVGDVAGRVVRSFAISLCDITVYFETGNVAASKRGVVRADWFYERQWNVGFETGLLRERCSEKNLGERLRERGVCHKALHST